MTEAEREQQVFPSEAKLQGYVLQRLRGYQSIVVVKVIKANIGGVSDILMCVGGQFVAVELKKDAQCTPTPLQKLFIARVKHAGGIARVCYTWGQVKDAIKEVPNSGLE